MHKAERDHVMTRLRPAERTHFRCLIQAMRPQASALSGHRRLARQGSPPTAARYPRPCAQPWRRWLRGMRWGRQWALTRRTLRSHSSGLMLAYACPAFGDGSRSASSLAAIRDPPSEPRSGAWRTSIAATVTMSHSLSSTSRRRTPQMAGRSRGM